MRRCIGCMESKPKSELIRIACYEGEVSLDPTGKAKGRGVYICPDEKCIQKARKKKSLARSFKIEEEKAENILKAVLQQDKE